MYRAADYSPLQASVSNPSTDGRPSLDIPSVRSRLSVSSQTSVNSLGRKDADDDSDYELEDYVMLASQVSALPLMQNQDCEQDIFLYAPDGKKIASAENRTRSLHVVCLDTQGKCGNWISPVVVTKLGMEKETKPIRTSPRARDYHGRRVIADGLISFRRKHRDGTNIHDPVEFYIGRNFPDNIDMIFGSQYIRDKRLLRLDKNRMLPMFAHKKKDEAEESKISEMEQAQQQGSQMIDVSRQSTVQQARDQAGHMSGSKAERQPDSQVGSPPDRQPSGASGGSSTNQQTVDVGQG